LKKVEMDVSRMTIIERSNICPKIFILMPIYSLFF